MRLIKVILLILFSNIVIAQYSDSEILKNILFENKDSMMNKVLMHPEIYRYQIIYTEINRDKHNNPVFKDHYLNVDSKLYFNPASTVKLPLAILSLEKMKTLKNKGITKNTSMLFDSSYSGQLALYTDSSSENGLPSITHFIKKAFLVSDNDAYNRMYEFVGQQQINKRLHEMGYPEIRITRRFRRLTEDENRHTSSIQFVDDKGRLIWKQESQYNKDSFDFKDIHRLGIGYINANDKLIHEPMDFTYANNLPLNDLKEILQSIMFPSFMPKDKRFHLKKDDYLFLRRYLSQYPSETLYPKYDTSEYYDSYVKYYFNKNRSMPENVRVFNKVGWAYGTLTDVSYVVDFQNNVEFMLSSTIYVNSDGILNDDQYEYENIGLPFLYQLGQAIYKHEVSRVRSIKPNLSEFQFYYEKRKEDNRPALKNIDN